MSSTQVTAVGRAVTSAQPYAWPYHGHIDPAQCALIACVDPAWRLTSPESEASDARMRGIAEALRAAGGGVVAVTRMPMRRPRGIVAAVEPRPLWPSGLAAEDEVQAAGTSGFYASPLDALLRARGFTDLLITGWGLEGPIHSTMRAANDRGYECLLVRDACTSLAPELTFSACEMVRFSGGIFGAFADAADVMQALAVLDPGAPTDRST
jgi:nicotinamidase-related amidase